MSNWRVMMETAAVEQALIAIPLALRGQPLMNAVVRAAEPIAIAARDGAPFRTGTLRKHIKARPVPSISTPERAFAAVSFRAPASASRHPAFYGLFQDRGTRPRRRKGRDGGRTGRVRPRRFFKKAFDQHQGTAVIVATSMIEQTLLSRLR